MNPNDSEGSVAQQSQVEAKPVKEKKPRTEAQKAATQKALAAMTAKRGQMIEERKQKKETVKLAKKVVEDKIIKEDIGFVMRNDFESKISSLTKEIGELRGLLSASQQKPIEKSTQPAKQERVVERVIERVPTPSAQPTKLTGHALLDKLFFEK